MTHTQKPNPKDQLSEELRAFGELEDGDDDFDLYEKMLNTIIAVKDSTNNHREREAYDGLYSIVEERLAKRDDKQKGT